jgi:hypothetical protein
VAHGDTDKSFTGRWNGAGSLTSSRSALGGFFYGDPGGDANVFFSKTVCQAKLL